MLESLIIHPLTASELTVWRARLPQGVMVVGPVGIGKRTVAEALAADAIKNVYTKIVRPDERGTISIESIRALYAETRSRLDRQQVVIIDGADVMSTEAQNSFLKLLEEPKQDVSFILTVAQEEVLLPTVISRVQKVTVRPVSSETLKEYALRLKPQLRLNELEQLLFIADGRPALMHELVTDQAALDSQKDRMKLAKDLLIGHQYDRLALIGKVAVNREHALLVLEAMQKMAALKIKTDGSSSKVMGWIKLCERIDEALQQISRNANIKAQLIKLFISV